jgi:sugar/nucleoside kinase (ribokinase family)
VAPSGANPFDIVGFGQNSVDLLTVVAEHPAANSKQRVQRFARLPGGQIATALAACERKQQKRTDLSIPR